MSRRIPIQKEVSSCVFNYSAQITEKDFETILDSIKTLLGLIKGQGIVLRHLLEANPPVFAAIIQKFIVMNEAQSESIMEMMEWAEGIVKEFWAIKYNNKEGQA